MTHAARLNSVTSAFYSDLYTGIIVPNHNNTEHVIPDRMTAFAMHSMQLFRALSAITISSIDEQTSLQGSSMRMRVSSITTQESRGQHITTKHSRQYTFHNLLMSHRVQC